MISDGPPGAQIEEKLIAEHSITRLLRFSRAKSTTGVLIFGVWGC